ncbi:MAG: SMC-Scp complex subunit ScpB [bacterium]|nr:SMC-Scp complex subunit ScpB [bacterium]
MINKENSNLNKIRALEAALFIYGEPMSLKKIQDLLKVTGEEIQELVKELRELLNGRGLRLIEQDASIQLTTHPDFAGLLETIVKDELTKDLTPATLETLAIVSYTGPITRSRIDYIRGVNSSYILRNLLIRGLVDRKTDPNRSNVYLYTVSFDLIRHLGLQNIDELPDFLGYRNLVMKAEQNLDSSLTPTSDEITEELKNDKGINE